MTTKSKLVIAMTGLAGVIAVFGTVAFFRGRSTTGRDAAIQNMRAIDAAKHLWALEESNAARRVSAKTNNSLSTP